MAYDRGGKQGKSYHGDSVATQAIKGRTATQRVLAKTAAFATGMGVQRITNDSDYLAMYNQIQPDSLPQMSNRTPGEQAYKLDKAYDVEVGGLPCRARHHRLGRRRVQRRQPVRPGPRQAAAQAYGLTPSQGELVDYWIRQLLGRPVDATGQTALTYHEAMDAVREIQENASPTACHPIYGAEVQRLHYNDLANPVRREQGRQPELQAAPGPARHHHGVHVEGLKLHAALGYGREDQLFDGVYLLALDGFRHAHLPRRR